MKATVFLVSFTFPPCPPVRYYTGHLKNMTVEIDAKERNQLTLPDLKPFAREMKLRQVMGTMSPKQAMLTLPRVVPLVKEKSKNTSSVTSYFKMSLLRKYDYNAIYLLDPRLYNRPISIYNTQQSCSDPI